MATDEFGFENYTVDEIRAAFANHASDDDWGVPSMYEDSLISALRGEFDAAGNPAEVFVTVDNETREAVTHYPDGSTTRQPVHPNFAAWMGWV